MILSAYINIYHHISRYLQIVIPGYPIGWPQKQLSCWARLSNACSPQPSHGVAKSHRTSSQRLQPRGSASLRSQPNVEPRRPLPVASRCTWPWGWDAPKKVEVTIGNMWCTHQIPSEEQKSKWIWYLDIFGSKKDRLAESATESYWERLLHKTPFHLGTNLVACYAKVPR